MESLKQKLVLLLIALTAFSCNEQTTKKYSNQKSDNTTTIVKGNISVTTSSDIEMLAKLLDFSVYRPDSVKFRYTFYDNSGKNERITVPGPSDYFLEALLYFDSLTMGKFYEFDRSADYPSPNFNKESFAHDWLPKEVTEELMNSDSTYHGHPDFFFGRGNNARVWYLKNKMLLTDGS